MTNIKIMIATILSIFSQASSSQDYFHFKKDGNNIYIIPSIHSTSIPIDWDAKYKKFFSSVTFDQVLFEIGDYSKNLEINQKQKKIYSEHLQRKIIDSGLSVSEFEKIPIHLAMFLYIESRKRNIGILNENGLDYYIRSNLSKKTTIEFTQSINEFVYEFSQTVSEKDAIKIFEKLTEISDDSLIIEDKILADSFKKSKQNTIYPICAKIKNELGPEYYKAIISNRNSIFIKKLMEKKFQHTLLVVGACHMYGPGSVIDLLREQGFSLYAG